MAEEAEVKKEEDKKEEEKNPEGWFEEVPLEPWPEPILPKISQPAVDKKDIFPGLASKDSLINILSYCHYLELTRLQKASKGLYHFVMDDTNRERIMCWEMSKEDQDELLGYQIRLMPAQEVYK